MIEMRVVYNGPMCRPDFQYRYHILIADEYSGAVYKKGEIWSEWKTAEWVEVLEFNGICRDNCQETKISSLPELPEQTLKELAQGHL